MADVHVNQSAVLNQLIDVADQVVIVLATLKPDLPTDLRRGADTAIERVQAARRSFGHLQRALAKPCGTGSPCGTGFPAGLPGLDLPPAATCGGAGPVGPAASVGPAFKPVCLVTGGDPFSNAFHTRLNARLNGVN